MELSRQRKIIIMAAVAIILLIVFLGVWWWITIQPNSLPVNNPVNTPADQAANDETQPAIVAAGEPAVPSQRNALSLARLFTERFGTFTSQSEFESIRDLSKVSTPNMADWLVNQHIPSLRNQYPSSKYVGQTTTILSVEMSNGSESAVDARVRTQQVLTVEGSAAVQTNPTLILKLTKAGETWLVDSARWE